MRVSVRWLQELADTRLPAAEIAARFTAQGIPVEEIIRIGEPLAKAVVAEVVSVQPRSVTLFDGKDIVELEISTAQLAENDHLAFIPETKHIVNEAEAGIEGSARPVILSAEAETGEPALARLDDEILVLESLPNRGDLTGLVGIARELCCALDQPFTLAPVELKEDAARIADCFTLEVRDPNDTPDYIARLVRGVRIGPSPFPLQWRLLACGVRPISNVVDVTNYILFKYGQPLHGFDGGHLAGNRVITRRAQPGEALTTIDGVERPLNDNVLVIADAEKPVAIAGIMGGLASEITERTQEVLIECARFTPAVIRRGARAIGLTTEASQRFEVGLDTGTMELASREAAAMMHGLAGGTILSGTAEVRTPWIERRFTVEWERTNRLLGMTLEPARMAGILRRLGFGVTEQDGRAEVAVPSFRFDIETTADLAEEIGRVVGYDGVPSRTQYAAAQSGRRSEQSVRVRRVRDLLVGQGLSETQTISFVSAELARRVTGEPVILPTPLNERYAALRPNLLLSLLEVASLNLRRGNPDLRLFEIGNIYVNPADPSETMRVAGIITGAREPLSWERKPEASTPWDIIGTVVSLLDALGLGEPDIRPQPAPGFQPGTAALVVVEGLELGPVGRIDPVLADACGIAEPVYGFDLDWTALWQLVPAKPVVHPLPRFPAVTRDYALILDAGVSTARLLAETRQLAGPLVEQADVFDHYAGKPLPAAKQSIGIRLTLRARERTLTSAEVDEFSQQLIAGLQQRLGVELRK